MIKKIRRKTIGRICALVVVGMFAAMTPLSVSANPDYWEVGGNAVTGHSKLGTTTNYDLQIITNNLQRMVIKADGKVGIGTMSPYRRLDVLDSTNPQLRLSQSDAFYTDLQTTSSGYLYIHPSGGRIGVGTTSPTATLDVDPTVTSISDYTGIKSDITFDPPGTGNTMRNWYGMYVASPTVGDNESITNRYAFVTEADAGNVGIGTTSPTEKLEVSGNIKADSFIGVLSSTGDQDNNNNLILNIGHADTDFTSGGGLNVAGNVGIGTTADPSYKLKVDGNTHITGTLKIGTSSMWLDPIDSPNNRIGASDSLHMIIDSAKNSNTDYFSVSRDEAEGDTPGTGVELFRIQENGNVGINTAPADTVRLHVVGETSTDEYGIYGSGWLGVYGRGVIYGTHGYVTPIGSGNYYGSFGYANPQTGGAGGGYYYGSVGKCDSTGTDISGTYVGVRGDGVGGTTAIGIYGYATGGTANNWAGYFTDGNVYIKNKLGIGTSTIGAYELTVNGEISANSVNTGHGDNELFAMDQNVRTTDGVTFVTVNTGHGANELYAMDQNVQTSDLVRFSGINVGGTYGADTGEVVAGLSDAGSYSLQGVTAYTSDYGLFLGGIHVGGTGDPGDDNLIVDGKAGIGITGSPATKLDINGGIKIADTSVEAAGVIKWDGLNFKGYTGSAWVPLDVQATSSSSWTRDGGPGVVRLTTGTDKVGIGTISPRNRLDVEGGMAVGASYSGTNYAPSDGMIIEGKVGIGTTSPGEKLSVNGNMMIGDSSWVQGTTTGDLAVEGKVGIGTTCPDSTLEILSSPPDPQLQLTCNDDTDYAAFTVWPDGNLLITTVGTNNHANICLLPDGNVGIGRAEPQGALNLDTDGTFDSDGVIFDTYYVQTTDGFYTTIATIPTNKDSVYALRVTVAGVEANGAWNTAHYVREATFRNRDNFLGALGSVSNVHTAESDTSWDVDFITSGTDIIIQVSGSFGKTVNWGATVEKNIVYD